MARRSSRIRRAAERRAEDDALEDDEEEYDALEDDALEDDLLEEDEDEDEEDEKDDDEDYTELLGRRRMAPQEEEPSESRKKAGRPRNAGAAKFSTARSAMADAMPCKTLVAQRRDGTGWRLAFGEEVDAGALLDEVSRLTSQKYGDVVVARCGDSALMEVADRGLRAGGKITWSSADDLAREQVDLSEAQAARLLSEAAATSQHSKRRRKAVSAPCATTGLTTGTTHGSGGPPQRRRHVVHSLGHELDRCLAFLEIGDVACCVVDRLSRRCMLAAVTRLTVANSVELPLRVLPRPRYLREVDVTAYALMAHVDADALSKACPALEKFTLRQAYQSPRKGDKTTLWDLKLAKRSASWARGQLNRRAFVQDYITDLLATLDSLKSLRLILLDSEWLDALGGGGDSGDGSRHRRGGDDDRGGGGHLGGLGGGNQQNHQGGFHNHHELGDNFFVNDDDDDDDDDEGLGLELGYLQFARAEAAAAREASRTQSADRRRKAAEKISYTLESFEIETIFVSRGSWRYDEDVPSTVKVNASKIAPILAPSKASLETLVLGDGILVDLDVLSYFSTDFPRLGDVRLPRLCGLHERQWFERRYGSWASGRSTYYAHDRSVTEDVMADLTTKTRREAAVLKQLFANATNALEAAASSASISTTVAAGSSAEGTGGSHRSSSCFPTLASETLVAKLEPIQPYVGQRWNGTDDYVAALTEAVTAVADESRIQGLDLAFCERVAARSSTESAPYPDAAELLNKDHLRRLRLSAQSERSRKEVGTLLKHGHLAGVSVLERRALLALMTGGTHNARDGAGTTSGTTSTLTTTTTSLTTTEIATTNAERVQQRGEKTTENNSGGVGGLRHSPRLQPLASSKLRVLTLDGLSLGSYATLTVSKAPCLRRVEIVDPEGVGGVACVDLPQLRAFSCKQSRPVGSTRYTLDHESHRLKLDHVILGRCPELESLSVDARVFSSDASDSKYSRSLVLSDVENLNSLHVLSPVFDGGGGKGYGSRSSRFDGNLYSLKTSSSFISLCSQYDPNFYATFKKAVDACGPLTVGASASSSNNKGGAESSSSSSSCSSRKDLVDVLFDLMAQITEGERQRERERARRRQEAGVDLISSAAATAASSTAQCPGVAVRSRIANLRKQLLLKDRDILIRFVDDLDDGASSSSSSSGQGATSSPYFVRELQMVRVETAYAWTPSRSADVLRWLRFGPTTREIVLDELDEKSATAAFAGILKLAFSSMPSLRKLEMSNFDVLKSGGPKRLKVPASLKHLKLVPAKAVKELTLTGTTAASTVAHPPTLRVLELGGHGLRQVSVEGDALGVLDDLRIVDAPKFAATSLAKLLAVCPVVRSLLLKKAKAFGDVLAVGHDAIERVVVDNCLTKHVDLEGRRISLVQLANMNKLDKITIFAPALLHFDVAKCVNLKDDAIQADVSSSFHVISSIKVSGCKLVSPQFFATFAKSRNRDNITVDMFYCDPSFKPKFASSKGHIELTKTDVWQAMCLAAVREQQPDVVMDIHG